MKVDNRRYDTDDIRRKHPLEAVARSYGVELRAEGKAFVGLCPFHPDRQTPNFYIYPSSRRWWCYVCKKGGDVIEFVRRREDISFLEACEKLDGTPPGEEQLPASSGPQRTRLGWECLSPGQQMLMDTAAASYRGQLWRTPWALDRLRQRGLEYEIIRECGLGYCDGTTFRDFVLQSGWLMRLAFGLGLLRSHRLDGTDTEPYETLAGRLVIPEYRAGHGIWFIGRLAGDGPDVIQAGGESETRPKYLGLPGAKPLLGHERVKDHSEIFLCEGPFDWLTAMQWGLPACSSCGTYVPADHLAFLAPSIVYGLLDPDEAGDVGHERLANELGDHFRPIRLPRGMDLNQLGVTPDGRERFRQLLGPWGTPWLAPDYPGYQEQPPWWRRFRVEFVPPWHRNRSENGHAA